MICNLLVQDFYSYLGFIQNAFSSILNSALQSNSAGTLGLAGVRYFSKGIFQRDYFISGNFLIVEFPSEKFNKG